MISAGKTAEIKEGAKIIKKLPSAGPVIKILTNLNE